MKPTAVKYSKGILAIDRKTVMGLGAKMLLNITTEIRAIGKYSALKNRRHDKDKFEEWKTAYYQFEGWDPRTGWPTRKTLDSLGMGYVADELQKNDRLGNDN